MVGMPYDLEKGPYFSVVEDFTSDRTRLIEALVKLRNGEPIAHLGPLESASLDPDGRRPIDRAHHLNEDWFGMSWDDVRQVWHRQPPPTCPPPDPWPNPYPTTGFWENWYGDAEGIMRETLIRAAEVALGLDHGEPVVPGAPPQRFWPIELFWKCQGPWFEGWVSWRRHGSGGQVTVILATPGNGSPIWRSPRRATPADEYAENPLRADGDRGMWVITHDHQERCEVVTSAPSPPGQFRYPNFGAVFTGCGDIVVVAPAERDGGVLHRGRAYVAPGAPVVPPIPGVVA